MLNAEWANPIIGMFLIPDHIVENALHVVSCEFRIFTKRQQDISRYLTVITELIFFPGSGKYDFLNRRVRRFCKKIDTCGDDVLLALWEHGVDKGNSPYLPPCGKIGEQGHLFLLLYAGLICIWREGVKITDQHIGRHSEFSILHRIFKDEAILLLLCDTAPRFSEFLCNLRYALLMAVKLLPEGSFLSLLPLLQLVQPGFLRIDL